MKVYGFQFKIVIALIDKENKGYVSFGALSGFIQSQGYDFTKEEFEALVHKIRGKDQQRLTYKEMMRAFSPF